MAPQPEPIDDEVVSLEDTFGRIREATKVRKADISTERRVNKLEEQMKYPIQCLLLELNRKYIKTLGGKPANPRPRRRMDVKE
jgi:hypothetical protein